MIIIVKHTSMRQARGSNHCKKPVRGTCAKNFLLDDPQTAQYIILIQTANNKIIGQQGVICYKHGANIASRTCTMSTPRIYEKLFFPWMLASVGSQVLMRSLGVWADPLPVGRCASLHALFRDAFGVIGNHWQAIFKPQLAHANAGYACGL